MGIFSSIRDAIMPDRKKAPAKAPTTQAPAKPAPPAKPVPMAEVDVEARLAAMPGSDKLNWRTSIVDLMKLVGIDSGYANRKELAAELGRSDYEGTADDNIWLHKRVMRELAANGGKVPAELVD